MDFVRYGLVYGNENIVFIKTGAGGGIRGYQDKYLRIAYSLHDRLGATVICASNPELDYEDQLAADRAMISHIAAKSSFDEYKVLLFGTSDGAYQNLILAQQIPQTEKWLGINTSLISTEDFEEKLQAIPNVQKIVVYGTEDDDFECVPVLHNLNCDNLEIITIEGADHEFTGMVEEFIGLAEIL